MRKQIAIAALLLIPVLLALTTCQMQVNGAGNGLTLRVLVPGGASGGGKGLGAQPKSLAHGATLTVTITKEGGTGSVQQTVALTGQTSVDFSFSLSSSGLYDVLAVMQDANGDTLAQLTTKLTVPAGNYPVVLTLLSSLLSNVVFTDTSFVSGLPVIEPFTPDFSPTVFSGYNANANNGPPYTLTLTTVDPKATLQVTVNGSVVSPSGSVYILTIGSCANPVIVDVTSADGSYDLTYQMNIEGGC